MSRSLKKASLGLTTAKISYGGKNIWYEDFPVPITIKLLYGHKTWVKFSTLDDTVCMKNTYNEVLTKMDNLRVENSAQTTFRFHDPQLKVLQH
jgi:hypothetical protein